MNLLIGFATNIATDVQNEMKLESTLAAAIELSNDLIIEYGTIDQCLNNRISREAHAKRQRVHVDHDPHDDAEDLTMSKFGYRDTFGISIPLGIFCFPAVQTQLREKLQIDSSSLQALIDGARSATAHAANVNSDTIKSVTAMGLTTAIFAREQSSSRDDIFTAIEEVKNVQRMCQWETHVNAQTLDFVRMILKTVAEIADGTVNDPVFGPNDTDNDFRRGSANGKKTASAASERSLRSSPEIKSKEESSSQKNRQGNDPINFDSDPIEFDPTSPVSKVTPGSSPGKKSKSKIRPAQPTQSEMPPDADEEQAVNKSFSRKFSDASKKQFQADNDCSLDLSDDLAKLRNGPSFLSMRKLQKLAHMERVLQLAFGRFGSTDVTGDNEESRASELVAEHLYATLVQKDLFDGLRLRFSSEFRDIAYLVCRGTWVDELQIQCAERMEMRFVSQSEGLNNEDRSN